MAKDSGTVCPKRIQIDRITNRPEHSDPYPTMNEYRKISATIRNRIRTGRYAVGESLPVRTDLAKEFGVARATLDRSIQLLEKEGWLHSRRGSGTVVARAHSAHGVAVIGRVGLSPMPVHPAFDFTILDPLGLSQRSERERLGRFEGLIWHLPSSEHLAWAREWQGKLPQIIVNRAVQGFAYVSTDHRGAIERLVSRRLAEHPDALPVYLAMRTDRPLVDELRQQGFVASCREVQRYYEILSLGSDFEENLKVLDSIRTWRDSPAQPLLLTSGTFLHTGAVMVWSRLHGLRWKQDVWYSDFDDTYPSAVWGVRVTSFVQDYGALFRSAIEGLLEQLTNGQNAVQTLVDPVLVEGDT